MEAFDKKLKNSPLMNKLTGHFILFIIVAFLVGCQDESQVFMPEIVSDVQETETVSVPPIQSNSQTETVEPTYTPEPVEKEPDIDPTPSLESDLGTADADVIFVAARLTENNSWTFSVTVSHPDTGWEDYADGWDVVLEDGTILKPDPESPFTRLLLHPHENEQPFTRSQSGIEIPDGVNQVTVRAHDIVDGYGGKEIVVDLTKENGPGFEVQR